MLFGQAVLYVTFLKYAWRVEGVLERYLSVFLPFVATVVLGHLIVRSSGSWQVQRMGLASPDLLRRLLVASGSAIALIVAVDVLSGGDLFLRPTSPRSELLIATIVVALIAARAASRALADLGERVRRQLF